MYVMQQHNLSMEDALHLVQNRRYCISPNGGFISQLKVRLDPLFPSQSGILSDCFPQEYESIYKARNAVASFPQYMPAATRRKRAVEDDEDEDERCVPACHSFLSGGSSRTFSRAEERKRALVEPDDAMQT